MSRRVRLGLGLVRGLGIDRSVPFEEDCPGSVESVVRSCITTTISLGHGDAWHSQSCSLHTLPGAVALSKMNSVAVLGLGSPGSLSRHSGLGRISHPLWAAPVEPGARS